MQTVPYPAAFLVAEISVFAALVVWITIALQLIWWVGTGKARDETLRRRFKVFLACVLIAAAYGAAFGSICGPAFLVPTGVGPLSAVKQGVIEGALVGAFGGGITGFLGTFRGRHTRWWLAGLLGSAAPAGCLWILCGITAAWESAPLFRDRILSGGLLAFSGILLIGGGLGAAVDSALRGGRSIVPGVQRLAAIINRGVRPQDVL